MQQILVYADSLSWGIIPGTRQRQPFSGRWPGVLERELLRSGLDVRVLEDCLNGRRTVWEDPFKPGRNGADGLAEKIEMHSPLALVILLLGTNDFQSMHQHVAWHSAQGIARLIGIIRGAPIEPGMPAPEILVVAPPAIHDPSGPIAPKFEGADQKCDGLSEAYRSVATELGCPFFDAGAAVFSSKVDGVHLGADSHTILGTALVDVVTRVLAKPRSA